MVQRVSGFTTFLHSIHGRAVYSVPSPRTAVLQAEENCFSLRIIFSTHQKHLSFIDSGFQCVCGAWWKFQPKAFSFRPPYRCFSHHCYSSGTKGRFMQVDHFVKHHFSAKCLPRFANTFPSGVFICTDEPSIQKHHRSQEHSTLPSLHSTMHLSFPSLFLALSAISFENFGLLKRVLSHSFPIFYRI